MIALCAVNLSVQAQKKVQDSLVYNARDRPVVSDRTYNLKIMDVAIPVALVSVSAISVSNGFLKQSRLDVQDALSNKGKNKICIDDYVQYSPMIAAYCLDLCRVKAKHKLKDRILTGGMSYIIMGISVNVLKQLFDEKRPDTEASNSFPSGHTATAFMGAEMLRKEYGETSPWIGYSGYAVAAVTGYLRIYNDRHYINDVIAGACIGVLSTKISYWLYPKIFTRSQCRDSVAASVLPNCSCDGLWLSVSINF